MQKGKATVDRNLAEPRGGIKCEKCWKINIFRQALSNPTTRDPLRTRNVFHQYRTH